MSLGTSLRSLQHFFNRGAGHAEVLGQQRQSTILLPHAKHVQPLALNARKLYQTQFGGQLLQLQTGIAAITGQ